MSSITSEKLIIPYRKEAGSRLKDLPPIHTATIAGEQSDESAERRHGILYLGMGNEGPRIVNATARRLGKAGLWHGKLTVVEGLPFRSSNSDPTSLKDFAAGVANKVAERVQDEHGQPDILDAFGESQAAISALESMSREGTPFNGKLGLIRPWGFTPGISVFDFLGSMARTAAQNEISLAAMEVGLRAGRRSIEDLALHRGGQLKSAMDYDGRVPLELILPSHEVGFFISRSDLVTPPDAIRNNLKDIEGDYTYDVEAEGPHAALATRVGVELGVRASAWAGLLELAEVQDAMEPQTLQPYPLL